MYSKKIAPPVVYEVTTMDSGQSLAMSEREFRKKIKNLEFIENIQYFRRYMVDKLCPQEDRNYIDQDPCLIVKSVLTEDELRQQGIQNGVFEDIRRNPAFYPDRLMMSYLNVVEPIWRRNVLFNNNLEVILEPQTGATRARIGFENVDMIKAGLNSFKNQLN